MVLVPLTVNLNTDLGNRRFNGPEGKIFRGVIDVADANFATPYMVLTKSDGTTPLIGQQLAAASLPMVPASDVIAPGIGSLTESSPGSDTSSSGLNGRLQRLAQHLTNVTTGTSALANVTGTTAGAAVVTDATGTVQQYLRGLVTLIAARLPTFGTAGTPSANVVSVQGVASGTAQPVSAADNSIVVLGAKADAKSTATDTTSITIMSVLKQISASIQAAAASLAGTLTVGSHAVTDGGGSLSIDDGGGVISIDDNSATISIDDGSGTITVDTIDGGNVVLGSTTGAAVVTDANGTIQQYLRGLVTLIAARLPTFGTAGTPSANVVSMQGVASGTAVPVSIATVPSHAVTDGGSSLTVDDGGGIISVDAADGGIVSIGTTTDAAVVAGAGGTLLGQLRAISRDLVANIVLKAGSAIIGKVGIDQTTPGTTDSVSVATGQGAGATIGTTSGAAITTSTTGTLQQYLRGLISIFTPTTSADGMANPSAAMINALQGVYHAPSSTWYRKRASCNDILISAVAQTTTQSSSLIANVNAKALIITVNVSVAPGGQTLTPKVQIRDDTWGGYMEYAAFTTIGATGQFVFVLAIGATGGAVSNSISLPVPVGSRVSMVHSGAGSWSYTVRYDLLT